MTSTTDTSKLVLADPREDTWPRWRFAASIGLYGAALGASVVVANIVGLTSKFAVDADALPPSDILYFMIVGGLSGLVVAGIAGYLMNRSSRAFASSTPRHPLGILPWAAIGAAPVPVPPPMPAAAPRRRRTAAGERGPGIRRRRNTVPRFRGIHPRYDFRRSFSHGFGGRALHVHGDSRRSGVRAWRMAHRPSCSLRTRADGPVRPASPRGAAFGHRDRRCPHPATIGPLAHRKRHDGDAVVQVGPAFRPHRRSTVVPALHSTIAIRRRSNSSSVTPAPMRYGRTPPYSRSRCSMLFRMACGGAMLRSVS